jgi:hypothetical protein
VIGLGLSFITGRLESSPGWLRRSHLAAPILHWSQPVIAASRKLLPEIEKITP